MKKIIISLIFIFLFIPFCVNAKVFTYDDIKDTHILLDPLNDTLDFNNFPSYNNTIVYLNNGVELNRDERGYYKDFYRFWFDDFEADIPEYQYYQFERRECLDFDCYEAIYYFNLFNIDSVKKDGEFYISSIKRVEKSSDTRENRIPEFNGLNCDFDVSFFYESDYIIYDINVVNDTNKDYELVSKLNFNKSEYLKYEIVGDPDSIVKAKTDKTIQLKISYVKDIGKGIYVEDNKFNLIVENGIKNPITSSNIIVMVIMILMVLISIFLFRRNKKYTFIFICLLLIPISIYALERKQLNIDTHIIIKKLNEFSYRNCDGGNYPPKFEFIVGETFEEFFERTGNSFPINHFYYFESAEGYDIEGDISNIEIQGSEIGSYVYCEPPH